MTYRVSLTAGMPCQPLTFLSNHEQCLNTINFGHSAAEVFHAISVTHFSPLVNALNT